MRKPIRISRRTALKAMGAAVGLPLLDAMVPDGLLRAAGAAEPARPPVRLGFVFSPNGVIGPEFFPAAEGALGDLPPTLEPLADVREHVLVLTGLALDNARAKGDGPGDHARASAAFLTTAHPAKTDGRDIRVGVSVDQVAAAALAAKTRLPSLELTAEKGPAAGRCDSGYSCAYVSNVSWRGPSTPAPGESNPRAVFERLFGSEADRRDEAARARRLRHEASILDLVADDAARLGARLGRRDREKLDEYREAVREVERRVERAESERRGAEVPEDVESPAGIPRDYREHLDLLYDLALLAVRTDATRVVTLMTGRAGSNRSYAFLGVPEGHHHLSHHQGDEAKIAKIRKIDRFQVEAFARFVGKLAATAEGEGTLLHSGLWLWGSGIGDGNRHTHHDLPILLAGRGGGAAAPGRHVRHPTDTPLANLYLTMLGAAGVAADSFGDSTGPLAGLAG